MLMVDLTPHAEVILDLIRQSGDWMNRRELAASMGKNRANVWDVHVLELLERENLIDVRKVEIPGPIGFEYQYRVKN